MSKQKKKKRGYKQPTAILTSKGYNIIKQERDSILKIKLPDIRVALQQTDEDKKPALEHEKRFLLKRVLLLNRWISNPRMI